jgi:hypothetical protein
VHRRVGEAGTAMREVVAQETGEYDVTAICPTRL